MYASQHCMKDVGPYAEPFTQTLTFVPCDANVHQPHEELKRHILMLELAQALPFEACAAANAPTDKSFG